MTGITIRGATAGELMDSVREQLRLGQLQPGEALPPVRVLATELGVNRNTVSAAYSSLAAAGIVENRRRGGTVVLGTRPIPGEGSGADAELVDLRSGNPDPALLPDWSRTRASYRPTLYGAPPVDPGLQAWVEAELGDVLPTGFRVVLTHGAVDAIERLLAAELLRRDAVAVEEPCFLSSIGALRANGYQTLPVPVDEEGMTPEGLATALAAGARAVILTSRAHNPTGASLNVPRAAALRDVLAEHPSVLVIEDDHFAGVAQTPFVRVAPAETIRWALVRSVSKYLGPDLRLAVVASDPATADALEARLSSAAWVSHLSQHVVRELVQDPATAQRLARARDRYAERIDHLSQALSRHGIAHPEASDGLNLFVPVHGDEPAVVRGLAERGWSVRPGADFAVAANAPSAIRVTTASITPQLADRFAADLAAILHAESPAAGRHRSTPHDQEPQP
jgi:DNA-binding transcriptional MocR family regulator